MLGWKIGARTLSELYCGAARYRSCTRRTQEGIVIPHVRRWRWWGVATCNMLNTAVIGLWIAQNAYAELVGHAI